jgi:hypothetical protein
MIKKLFILIIFIVTGVIASPALAYTSHDGDLVKTSSSPAVYYIGSAGTRHLFSTESTFFSWYTGYWKDQTILILSESEFNQLASGKNVTARPGFALLRFDNSSKIYAVLPGGKLCAVSAPYNSYQYNRVLVIPAGFEIDYYKGDCDITAGQNLPEATLLKYSNSSDIYYIQNGQRRRISTSGFNSNNFRNESIVTDISSAIIYPEGATINGYEYSIANVAADLNLKLTNNNPASCIENWNCGVWSACSYGSKYRSCTDSSNCGTTFYKPATTQSCSACNENWSCTNWSSCAYNWQYRTCADSSNCGTSYGKPTESQSCSSCNENWSCSSWGSCANGWQYRSCWDNRSCGTTYSKPITSQRCSCNENWVCSNWSTCQGSGSVGTQYRSCLDRNNCNTRLKQPATSQNCKLCTENWSCTDWNTCINGRQSRACQDLNRCGTSLYKPITSQNCY